ncbi:MAG: YkvA family protein [Lachnospiraceae bacterium]
MEIVGRWILESLVCARESEMSDKLKARAKQLKNDVPAVFLSLKDKDTPVVAKIVAAITVAYALSPIDLIPDFIPVLGYLDDVILLPALIALTIRLIPKDIWEKNKHNAEDMWKEGRPKKWFYAIPIILLWVLIVWLIMKAV